MVKVNGVIGGIAVSYSGKVLEAANKPTFGFFCADTMTVLLRQYKKNVLPLLQAKEAEEDEYYLERAGCGSKVQRTRFRYSFD